MPKIEYVPKKFRGEGLQIVIMANEIIEEYQAAGYDLTLRQLYYQLIARDWLPDSWREKDPITGRRTGTKNTERSYKNLGNLISDARLAGLIDWLAIVDRTRNLRSPSFWSSPASIIQSAARSYAVDMWKNQPYRPEVWVEKEALAGVIDQACESVAVPWFACRGYVSQSEMWAAARRLQLYANNGQQPIIFHLGDHDPSGIDMTRDIIERLELFIGNVVTVKRIALNWEQIQEYSPPPNPAKLSDSRANGYLEQYGDESWELDALDPQTLTDLIQDEITAIMDREQWEADKALETEGTQTLAQVSRRWNEVRSFLQRSN